MNANYVKLLYALLTLLTLSPSLTAMDTSKFSTQSLDQIHLDKNEQQYSNFCIIKGDYLTFVSCSDWTSSYLVDSDSLLTTKSSGNKAFKFKRIFTENEIIFSNVLDVYQDEGQTSILTEDNQFYGFYPKSIYDNAPATLTNSLNQESIKYFNNLNLQVTLYENETIGNYLNVQSVRWPGTFLGQVNFGKYARVNFAVFEMNSTNYYLYVTRNSSSDTILRVIPVNIYSAIDSYQDIQVANMCFDEISVSDYYIIMICQSSSSLVILKRQDYSIIYQNSLDTEQLNTIKISDGISNNRIFYIQGSNITYIFYQTTNNTESGQQFYNLNLLEIINTNLTGSNQQFIVSTSSKFIEKTTNFQAMKLREQYITMQYKDSKNLSSYEMCFNNQYYNGQNCSSCPSGQFTLNYDNTKCYDCQSASKIQNLSDFQQAKFIYFCLNFVDPNLITKQTNQSQNKVSISIISQEVITITEVASSSFFSVSNIAFIIVFLVLIPLIVVGGAVGLTLFCYIKKKRNKEKEKKLKKVVIKNEQQHQQQQQQVLVKTPSNSQISQHSSNEDSVIADDIKQDEDIEGRNEVDKQDGSDISIIKNLKWKTQLLNYQALSQEIKVQSSCSICLQVFDDKDMILQTECIHIFHQICLEDWTKNHSVDTRCPTCGLIILEDNREENVQSERLSIQQPQDMHLGNNRENINDDQI